MRRTRREPRRDPRPRREGEKVSWKSQTTQNDRTLKSVLYFLHQFLKVKSASFAFDQAIPNLAFEYSRVREFVNKDDVPGNQVKYIDISFQVTAFFPCALEQQVPNTFQCVPFEEEPLAVTAAGSLSTILRKWLSSASNCVFTCSSRCSLFVMFIVAAVYSSGFRARFNFSS